MTRLVWDAVGERRFETGVDRGVLYTLNNVGIPWNGLTSVSENSPGAEVSAYYLDGIKYLETIGREDFAGTIEAFTYPDEFAIHDGSILLSTGLIATQQRRRSFALSYRTRIGNDADGQDHGYKIHLVYNVLAQPSDKSYGTTGDSADPIKFSWAFTTIPKKPVAQGDYAPLAHLIIDSTKTDPSTLRYIEERLYGSSRENASLISLNEMFELFETAQFVLSILANRTTGLSQLIVETDGTGDLFGERGEGLYDALSETRLTQTAHQGLYTLEP